MTWQQGRGSKIFWRKFIAKKEGGTFWGEPNQGHWVELMKQRSLCRASKGNGPSLARPDIDWRWRPNLLARRGTQPLGRDAAAWRTGPTPGRRPGVTAPAAGGDCQAQGCHQSSPGCHTWERGLGPGGLRCAGAGTNTGRAGCKIRCYRIPDVTSRLVQRTRRQTKGTLAHCAIRGPRLHGGVESRSLKDRTR